MKTLLRNLILLSCILLLGVVKANATAVTVATNNTASMTAGPITSTPNAVVLSFSLKNNSAGNARATTFNFTTGTGLSALNAGATSISLYSSASATFTGATLLSTLPTTNTNTFAITIAGANLANGNQLYYYLVENFTQPTTAGSYQFAVTSVTGSTGTYTGTPATGYLYTWGVATGITYTAYNTLVSNGLAANPLSYSQTYLPIYGFSLAGTGAGAATALTALTLTNSQYGTYGNGNSNYFNTVSLYSSTSPNFPGVANSGTPNAGATLITSVPSDGTNTVSFTGINLPVTSGGTTYYFVVITPLLTQSSTSLYELDYSSSSTATITAATANKGFAYTVNSPVVLSAPSTTTGFPAFSPTVLNTTFTQMPIAGVTVTNNGTTAFPVKYLDWTSTVIPNTYFTNYKLYVNLTGNTFTGTGSLTAVPINQTTTMSGSATDNYVTISTPATLSIPAGASYTYFLVADYATPPATNTNFTITSYYAQSAAATYYAPTNTINFNYLLGPPTYDTYTVTSLGVTTPTASGLTSDPINSTRTNAAVYGLQITGAGASTTSAQGITAISFTSPSANNLTYYFSNFRLYSSTNPIFQGTTDPASTLLQTIAAPAAKVLNFNTIPTQTVAYNSTLYYFVVVDYNSLVTTASTFELDFTKSTSQASLTTAATGRLYNLPAGVKGTITSLGAASAGVSGLATDPLIVGATNLPIYGFKLTGSTTGTIPAVLNTLTFNNATFFDSNSSYYSSISLYSSTNPIFQGISDPSATLVQTVNSLTTAPNNSYSITFNGPTGTGLNISIGASSTAYYFIVINTISAYAGDYELDYGSSTGTTLAGTTTTGWDYTITTPTAQFANNTTGVNQTAPYYYTSTTDVLESFGVTTNTASKFNSFTLEGSVPPGNFFTNLKVVYSTNPNYANDIAGTGVTPIAVPATFSYGGTSVGITLTGGLALPANTPIYFFVTADFTTGQASLPSIYQFTVTGASVTCTATSGADAVTNSTTGNPISTSTPMPYTTYNLVNTVSLGTATTTGFAANPLSGAQTAQTIFGFSVYSGPANIFTTFNISSTQTIGSYFSNFKLMVNTTNSLTGATQVTTTTDPGFTVSTLNSTTLTISGLSQTISNTTKYYFLTFDYTPPASTVTPFTLTLNSAATSSTTYTMGGPIVGTAYTLSPAGTITYYWLGANTQTAAQADWRTTTNWSTTPNSTTNIGTYPGSLPTDNVIFASKAANTAPLPNIGAYAINVAAITVLNPNTANCNVTLTINAAGSLKTGILNVGGTAQTNQLGVVTGPMTITGPTTIGSTSTFGTSTGTINLGPTVTLNGATGSIAQIGVTAAAGIINATNTTFNFNGTSSAITQNNGTINATDCTFNETASASIININAGTFNALKTSTGCTFNLNTVGSTTSSYITASGGSFNVTGGTINDAGTLSYITNQGATSTYTNCTILLNGAQALLQNTSGTTTLTGTSVNVNGTYVAGVVLGVYNSGGTFTAQTGSTLTFTTASSKFYNYGGTSNLTASTMNFNGTGTVFYNLANYSAPTFNATSSSIVNFAGSGSQFVNDSYNYACNFNLTNSTATFSGSNSQLYNYSDYRAVTVTSTGSTLNFSGATSNLYNLGYFRAATVTLTGPSSTVNFTGAGSYLYNNANTSTATVTATATTINLGSAGGGDGANSYIKNTNIGTFNLAAGSVLNINGSGANYNNALYNSSGTNYYGATYIASTAVINPNTTSATTGIINNDGPSNYFTLFSDGTGSATIGTMVGHGTITGLYDVQRYLVGGTNVYRNYRLLSSAVNKLQAAPGGSNNIDMSYLGASATPYQYGTTFNGAYTAGPGSGFAHTTTNPVIYLYQEAITPGTTYNKSFTSGKNVGVTAINTSSPYNVTTLSTAAGGTSGSGMAIPAGNGYLLYYIGNNQRTNTATTTLPTASTMTASGYVNQATIPLYMWGSPATNTLTYTTGALARYPGLTMVGNPYPATLDLQKVYLDNSTALDGTFYELNDQTQNFPTYNGASGTYSATGSQYVASGQGFYIELAAGVTDTLTFKEDQKATSTTGPIFPSPSLLSVTPPANGDKAANSVVNPQNNKQVNSTFSSKNVTDEFSNKLRLANLKQNSVKVTQTKTIIDKPITGSNVSVAMSSQNVPIHNTSNTDDEVTTPAPASLINTALPSNVIIAANLKSTATGLHLKLIQDSVTYDECGIFFNTAWTDKFEKYDSKDLDGLNPKVYMSSFTSDNVRSSINALGDYSKGKRVPLYVKAIADGNYTLQLEDINNISNKYNVFLVDNLNKDSIDIVKYKTYNFNMSVADTASFSSRFVLAIEHAPVPQYQLISFSGQKVQTGVQLNWKTQNESDYTGFGLQKLVGNSYVTLDSLQSDSLASYNYIDQHPTLGNNIYRLAQNDINGKVTYSTPITIGYNTTPGITGGLTIYPNPSKSIINVTLGSSTANGNYTSDIYNTSGTLIGHRDVTTNSWTEDISSYKLGVYIIELKNSNGILVGKGKFVKIN